MVKGKICLTMFDLLNTISIHPSISFNHVWANCLLFHKTCSKINNSLVSSF